MKKRNAIYKVTLKEEWNALAGRVQNCINVLGSSDATSIIEKVKKHCLQQTFLLPATKAKDRKWVKCIGVTITSIELIASADI